MPNTYTYAFASFDKAPSLAGFADVVTAIHWTITASDGSGGVTTAS